MNMNINKTYVDNNLTVQVEGRIDTITSQELEESLNEDIEKIDTLTLDFKELEYISSAGLRV
ncbi:MAG: STAS domain-containing protein, partial [Methanosphaera sp.]|nr:STAS domain-containing protein [Methanosphaera sp.]